MDDNEGRDDGVVEPELGEYTKEVCMSVSAKKRISREVGRPFRYQWC